MLVDGKAVSMDAIVLTDDQGGGYTYFKLRDLGAALGFKVDWTAQRGVIVETDGDSAPVVPETPVTGTKDIEVTSETTQWGVGCYVKDNGFGDGKLNNGKPITEENVLELLAEAEKIWPTSMSWTKPGTLNNHWYEWSGSVVDRVLLRNYNESTNYACGGFASMVSDYLFGLDSNPMHRVTDSSKIRPGDIIIHMTNGKVSHVTIAVSSPIVSGDLTGRVWTADGNSSSKVRWPEYQYGSPASEAMYNSFGTTWEIWSRYPA